MLARLELVAIEGPLQGQHIDLPESGSLIIGRSRRGLHLPDAAVSLEHAEITRTGGRFAVTDLGSVSGTFVNGRKLGRESMSLAEGSTLKIGESLFRLEEPKRGRAGYVALAVVAITFLAGFAYVAKLLAAPVTFAPAIVWHEPVPQGGGKVDPVVPIPIAFVRTEGMDQTSFYVHRITDYDQDGAAELWLLTNKEELVIRVDQGRWDIIGRLPTQCLDFGEVIDFPEIKCGSMDIWSYVDGRYQLVVTQGVTAWVDYLPRPNKDGTTPPKAAGPVPFRVAMSDVEKLTGFLSVRGIEEPIHYLVCEGFFPGIGAQVLTQKGVIKPLHYGCIRELGVLGVGDLSGEIPGAIAFTVAGRKALIADLTEYVSGSPDGLFLDPGSQAVIDAIASEPQSRITNRLDFTGASIAGTLLSFDTPVPTDRRTMYPAPGAQPAPRGELVTVFEDVQKIDPPGCAELEVRTKSWFCILTKACTPGNNAVEVHQVGCDAPAALAKVPYTGGVWGGGDANIQVRVAVDSHGGSGRVDILRTRVAWREMPEAAPAPAPTPAPAPGLPPTR